jgi:predicted ArsR family transcriptional regulator
MSVRYDPAALSDINYAFGVLCSEFLDQSGREAEKTISRLCRQMGMAIGKQMRRAMGEETSFENAVRVFVAASEQSASPARILLLEGDRAILEGRKCPFHLKDRGREVCEAVMALDCGILETASRRKVTVTVKNTMAAGDDRCQVLFEAD